MQTITERGRRLLYEQAEASWGKEVADTLMALLPPVGWAEVATKADLAALEKSVKGEIAGLRGEIAGLRGEMKSEIASMLRIFVFANITTVIAVCGMAFGIARYA